MVILVAKIVRAAPVTAPGLLVDWDCRAQRPAALVQQLEVGSIYTANDHNGLAKQRSRTLAEPPVNLSLGQQPLDLL